MPIRTLLTQPRFSLASLTRFHDALLRSPRRSESGNTAACLRSSPCVRSVNGTAVRAIVIAAAFFVTTIGLFAQAPPSADTFAWKLTPRVNYGALPILVVDANNTTYVRFDLSSIPSGSTVSKATLVLFVDAASGSGDVDAYDVESAWQESTLTSQNAPILGPSASGAQPTALTVASLNNFISIDVTTTVSAWLDGSLANNGLAVALVGPGGAFSFDSKESSLTSHQPQLIVQLAGSGVPGPQGPQGPTGSEGPAGPNGAAGPVGPI